MEKTLVFVQFNGWSQEFYFKIPYKEFHKHWTNQIVGVGYVSLFDENGKFVIINPSQCGYITIENVKS
jgi:hypothetical protein